jgi:hypothetical protein
MQTDGGGESENNRDCHGSSGLGGNGGPNNGGGLIVEVITTYKKWDIPQVPTWLRGCGLCQCRLVQ